MATGLPYARTRSHIPGVTPVGGDVVDSAQDALVALWASAAALGGLGDGSDGDPVCDGVNAFAWATLTTFITDGIHRYRLNRDIYVNTITVTGANVAVDNNGFRIYHRGKAKATGGAVGFICNGVYGSGLVDGGAQGNNGTLLGGGAGGNGVAGAVGGVGGGALVSLGGVGGAGGNGPAHNGGAGGPITTNAAGQAQNPGLRMYTPHLFGYLAGAGFGVAFTGDVAVLTPLCGGGGGGAGGDSGGQGGAGAGVLAMAGLELELDTATQVQSKGGNGAIGQAANSGGGGGGGGGGLLLAEALITILDGTVITAAANCAGGLGGAGTGTGAAGAAGAHGDFRINVLRVPFTPATAAAIPPTAMPAVYVEPLPNPANFPVNAVIVDKTTNIFYITYDQLNWTALTTSIGGGGPVSLIVANVAALTAALAASVVANTIAITRSTNQMFITYDRVNWTALS